MISRPLIRPLIRQLVQPLDGVERRYLTTLDSSLQQYLDLETWTPQGSFTASRLFATTASNDELFSGELAAEDCIILAIVADQITLSCYIGTTLQTVITGAASAHNDGYLHLPLITYDSGTNEVELLVDGVSIGTATWVLNGNQTIKYVGKRGTSYSDSVVADIKLIDGVDDRISPVKNTWVNDTVVVNSAATIGSEEVVNGTFDAGTTGWTARRSAVLSVVSSKLRVTNGALTSGLCWQSMPTTVGKMYLLSVDFTYSGIIPGDLRVGTAVEGSQYFRENDLVSDKSLLVTFIATTATAYISLFNQGGGAGDYNDWDTVSVKAAPGYGIAVEMTEGSAEAFTFDKKTNSWRNEFAPNLLPYSDDSRSFISNSAPTTPAVDNAGIAPSGENTAWKLGTPVGGAAQRNLAIPKDHNYYTVTIEAKAISSTGVISAKVGVHPGSQFDGVIYDAATDALGTNWVRVDLPDGWMRLSSRGRFRNAGTSTLFTCRLNSITGSDQILFGRYQVEIGFESTSMVKTDSDPVKGKILQLGRPDLHILGDSFVPATMVRAAAESFILRASSFTIDGVSSSSLSDQKIRFDSTPERYGDTLVILDGGFNGTVADAKTAIDGMVAHLGHDRWVWVQPSPAEDIAGSPARIAWDADIAEIAAHVGADHYVECLEALKAGNDGSVDDLQDVVDNIVPRSLRTDVIHENDEGTAIRTKAIASFITAKEW